MEAFGGAELFESDHSDIIDALTVEGQSCLRSVPHLVCSTFSHIDMAIIFKLDEGAMFKQPVLSYDFYTRYQLLVSTQRHGFILILNLDSWEIKIKTSNSDVKVKVSITSSKHQKLDDAIWYFLLIGSPKSLSKEPVSIQILRAWRWGRCPPGLLSVR